MRRAAAAAAAISPTCFIVVNYSLMLQLYAATVKDDALVVKFLAGHHVNTLGRDSLADGSLHGSS